MFKRRNYRMRNWLQRKLHDSGGMRQDAPAADGQSGTTGQSGGGAAAPAAAPAAGGTAAAAQQPAAAPARQPSFDANVNERNAAYLASNPEALDDLLRRVEEKRGGGNADPRVSNIERELWTNKAMRKWKLDDDDEIYLTGRTESEIMGQAERIAAKNAKIAEAAKTGEESASGSEATDTTRGGDRTPRLPDRSGDTKPDPEAQLQKQLDAAKKRAEGLG